MALKKLASPQFNEEPGAEEKRLKQGAATEMWLELIAYGKDGKDCIRSLWLRVNGTWLRYDNPDDKIESAVLSAFGDCSSPLQVRVWYLVDKAEDEKELGDTDPKEADRNYSTEIVGLVVHSK